ncbi:hypothetical protein D3C85_997470 [compost metagenome]
MVTLAEPSKGIVPVPSPLIAIFLEVINFVVVAELPVIPVGNNPLASNLRILLAAAVVTTSEIFTPSVIP